MTTPSTYKLGQPALKYSVCPSIVLEQNPTSSDVFHPTAGGYIPISTVWVNKSNGNAYILVAISGNTATWSGLTDSATGNVDGPASSTDNALARFDGTTGKLIQNSVGILSDAGILTDVRPTLPAGTATAGTAPLTFTAGTNLTAPEAGAMEYDGTILYYTDGTATRRPIVTGPASVTDDMIARFDGTTGKIIQSSLGIISDTGVLTGLTSIGIGIAPTAYLGLAAGTATAGTAPLKFALGVNLTSPEAGAVEYDGTHLFVTDNVPTRRTVTFGPSASTDTAIARYRSTIGEIQDSDTTLSDAEVMTFPAGGGVVMTAAAGAAERKGTSVFGAGGISAAIATTAVAADSIIVITRTNLAGAGAVTGNYVTITPATSFTVTSGDAADTSSFNWAIVG